MFEPIHALLYFSKFIIWKKYISTLWLVENIVKIIYVLQQENIKISNQCSNELRNNYNMFPYFVADKKHGYKCWSVVIISLITPHLNKYLGFNQIFMFSHYMWLYYNVMMLCSYFIA